MDDSKLRFGVGVLVIAAIGIAVILTFLFGAFPAILNREYTVLVDFESAEGINVNAAVLRDGVKIGRVDDIKLKDEGGVQLTLSLDENIRMTHQYIPQIGFGSLITGDSKLEFRKATSGELARIFDGDEELINQPYTDGEWFQFGRKLDDPFTLLFGMEGDLKTAFKSVGSAGDAITGIGKQVEGLVQDVRAVIGVPTAPPNNAQPMSPSDSGRLPQSMSAPPKWAAPVVWKVGHQSGGTHQGFVVQAAAFQPPGTPPSFSSPDSFSMQQRAMQQNAMLQAGNGTPTIAGLAAEAQLAVDDFRGLIQDLQGILGNERFQSGVVDAVEKAPGILDSVTQTLRNADRTFREITETGKQFKEVGKIAESALSQTSTEIQSTLKSVQSTAKSFEGTAENIEAFTEPLGERSGELIEAVLVSLANVDNALVQLDTFGRTVNNSDGTVKRLLEDDELYYQIQRTIQNIEAASARFRPILDDVRVFSDKIARDPRQLGVRGAITNRPNGMGLK